MRNPHQNRKEKSQNIEKSHAKKREEKTVIDVQIPHFKSRPFSNYSLPITHCLFKPISEFQSPPKSGE